MNATTARATGPTSGGPWPRSLRGALLLAALAGCATERPAALPDAAARPYAHVAALALTTPPEVHMAGFVTGKGTGALAVGGHTFLECASALGHGSGPFVLVGLMVCGGASVVGATVGAITAPSAADVRNASATLSAAATTQAIQASLRDAVLAEAQRRGDARLGSGPDPLAPDDWRAWWAAGIDAVAEVGISAVKMPTGADDAPVPIIVEARLRVLRTADGALLADTTVLYDSPRRRLRDWSSDAGVRVQRELEAAYATLARHLYEAAFMLYPFPDGGRQVGGFPAVTTYGLRPVTPPLAARLRATVDRSWNRGWQVADSLQPTFAWEAFPRAADRASAAQAMRRVQHVRYELMVADEQFEAPNRVIYRVDGLREPRHQIPIPLHPGARYFWTVRARFTLEGEERVTPWSRAFGGPKADDHPERVAAPSPLSYAFRAP